MLYVLRHNQTGKYVAVPGGDQAYTGKLEEAITYTSEEKARANSCVESESVVKLESLLQRPV